MAFADKCLMHSMARHALGAGSPGRCNNQQAPTLLPRHPYFSAGAYLCVRAYGAAPVSFSLKATLDRCPSDFDEDGTPVSPAPWQAAF